MDQPSVVLRLCNPTAHRQVIPTTIPATRTHTHTHEENRDTHTHTQRKQAHTHTDVCACTRVCHPRRRLFAMARTGERLARYFLNGRCKGGATPLVVAARAGQVSTVSYLLSVGEWHTHTHTYT